MGPRSAATPGSALRALKAENANHIPRLRTGTVEPKGVEEVLWPLPFDPHQLKRPAIHPSFNESLNLRSRAGRIGRPAELAQWQAIAKDKC
jgi:hypothetical protein